MKNKTGNKAESNEERKARLKTKREERQKIRNENRIDLQVYDTKTAAKILGLSEQRLRLWRCYGGGPVYIRYDRNSVTGKCFYTRESLENFINGSQCENTSQETARIQQAAAAR